MGIIIPEDDYQVTFIWSNELTTKQYTTSLGIIDAGSHGGDPTALADEAWDAATDDFPNFGAAASMADTWHFVGTSAIYMSSSGPIVGQHLEDVAGTGSDNDIPVNCACLVKKNTASGGRANRGRMFVPPVYSGFTTDTNGALIGIDGTITAASVGSVAALLVTNEWVPCLHHSDGSPGTVITSYTGVDTLATQRRRLR
jgi:hypothetical protein